MVKKTHDVVVKVGTYPDGEGSSKNKYENVGALMENDEGGNFILLKKTFNPAGVPGSVDKESVLLSLFKVGDDG